jgi:hypothetical protein
MGAGAKPSVSFSTRIDLETDKRLKKLQRKFGVHWPEMMRLAVDALERSVAGDQGAQPAG